MSSLNTGHWADLNAEKVIREKGEKPLYTCASGITPSGTVHIGNFREIISVDLVVRALRDRGKQVRFIYSWDDYDVFRKVPKNMPQGELLAKYLRMRQLQLLLALQQSGSILQAAKKLHMSQSAATQALSELEKVLELQLFERHARGIRATAAGKALIDSATAVMHTLEDTASVLVEISSGAKAALRLGVIPAATYALLSARLTHFYDQHPDVLVDIQEGRGRELWTHAGRTRSRLGQGCHGLTQATGETKTMVIVVNTTNKKSDNKE
jgi:molybdate transport repressor ModE-like protein